jgi:hypothetical protein
VVPYGCGSHLYALMYRPGFMVRRSRQDVIAKLATAATWPSTAFLLIDRRERLDRDELRQSRKSVAIGLLTWSFCDILCECPRGTRLPVS